MSGIVVLVGLESDPAIAAVARRLSTVDVDVVHWTCRELLNDIAVRLRPDGGVDGVALVGDRTIELSEAASVFTRQSPVEVTPEYRELEESHPTAIHARRASAVVSMWTDIAPCRVVNRPCANDSNSTKPFQAQLISRFFEVPPTLVTNDPGAAVRFAGFHERVIVKSCSGERSIVSEVTESDIEARADAIRRCPVQFQAYVPGRDVRVHVVGASVIATEITSSGSDYRYDADAVWRPTRIDDQVGEVAVALTAHLGLELAGLDLRLGPDGRVVCFEVNPSPAFTAYEEATGQDITGPVCDALVAPARAFAGA